MAARYVLKRSGDQFMFNLKAVNGEIILTSERYHDRSGAQNGIESVRTHSPIDANYRRKISSSGDPYFNLVATNGKTIGTSEMYSSGGARDNGIDSVKQNGPGARVDDDT